MQNFNENEVADGELGLGHGVLDDILLVMLKTPHHL
jgi:hypothetical protein